MLTKTQRRNLAALALGLENLPRHKRKEHFDMDHYIRAEGGAAAGSIESAKDIIKKNPCGTNACAAGWGIILDIGSPDETLNTIDDYVTNTFTNNDGEIYNFLFSDDWSSVDNTALGAAARIRYFLANGVDDIEGIYYYRGRPDEYKALIAPYREKSIEKRIKALAG